MTIEGDYVTISLLTPESIDKLKEYGIFHKISDDKYGVRYRVKVLDPVEYEFSIIKVYGSYGVQNDLWEVAVVRENKVQNHLLEGFLTEEEVLNCINHLTQTLREPLDFKV